MLTCPSPSSHGPRYVPGGASTAAVALLVAILALTIRFILSHQNKKLAERDAAEASGEAPSRAHGGASDERATGFRYIL